MPKKNLYESREDLEMYTIMKLELIPHYDGFEANDKRSFKNIV